MFLFIYFTASLQVTIGVFTDTLQDNWNYFRQQIDEEKKI